MGVGGLYRHFSLLPSSYLLKADWPVRYWFFPIGNKLASRIRGKGGMRVGDMIWGEKKAVGRSTTWTFSTPHAWANIYWIFTELLQHAGIQTWGRDPGPSVISRSQVLSPWPAALRALRTCLAHTGHAISPRHIPGGNSSRLKDMESDTEDHKGQTGGNTAGAVQLPNPQSWPI